MARGRPFGSLLIAAALGALATAGVADAALARQAGPRQVLKVTRLALQANRGVQLEHGVDVSAAESTLWVMPGSAFWQLQPSHGTVLATDGVTSRRGPGGCRAVTRWAAVASAPLRAGTFQCVMTHSGDYAEVKVEAVTATQVTLSYILWDGL